jgi:hypothetical protein
VSLLAFNLFARIVTVRINPDPPFSAPFTLWLSMMAVVGLDAVMGPALSEQLMWLSPDR